MYHRCLTSVIWTTEDPTSFLALSDIRVQYPATSHSCEKMRWPHATVKKAHKAGKRHGGAQLQTFLLRHEDPRAEDSSSSSPRSLDGDHHLKVLALSLKEDPGTHPPERATQAKWPG